MTEPRACVVDGCDKPMKYGGTGWCVKHYHRYRTHGTLTLPVRVVDRPALMWAKLDIADCWLFTGSRNDFGYGHFWNGEKLVMAHRWTYEYLVGPIPEGLELDHLCRPPPCCNPDHLEPVSTAENNRRSGSATARNARKTHCKRGHPLDGVNVRYANGGRVCVTCDRANRRAARLRRRAAAANASG